MSWGWFVVAGWLLRSVFVHGLSKNPVVITITTFLLTVACAFALWMGFNR